MRHTARSSENQGIFVPSIEREFVSLVSPTAPRNGAGFYPCQGLYHRPKDKRPKIAFIATHYNVDFSEHYIGDFMAQRGFGFLGWNTRFRGNEAFFMLEHALIDIGVGMRWLQGAGRRRSRVILGNSGGGSLMGAYQSQAVDPNITRNGGRETPPAVNELIAADLYMSRCARTGRPEVLTAWMDPSVTDERDPTLIDQSLNLFNPDNGPPYSRRVHRALSCRAGRAQRQASPTG